MAPAAQRDAVRRHDPVTYVSRAADVDTEIDAAVTWFANVMLSATIRQQAIALKAAHELWFSTDPDARSLAGATTSNNGRSASASDKLPAGYPADYYESSFGRRLIGVLSSSTSVSIPMAVC